MFQFTHQEYLYALALIPLFMVLFIWVMISRKKILKRFGDVELVARLMPDASTKKPVLKFILLMIAYFFVVIGVAGPKYGTKLLETKRSGSEIIIALDVSNSMLAEDIRPNRLERAKQALSQLIDRLGENRIGLVVFAGEAYTQLPITADYVSAKMFLSTISPDIVPVQGTAIGAAINLAANSFSPASEAGKAIIVITDGENHEDDPVEAAKEAAKKGIIVHAIGIGSTQGVPIPIKTRSGQRDFVKDRNGNVVITKLDEKTLQEMVIAGNGLYVRATTSNMGLNEVYNQINKLEKAEYDAKVYTDFAEMFQWAFGVALLFLLIELLISNRRSRLRLFFCIAFLVCFSDGLLAQQLSSSNKSAIKAFNTGHEKFERNQFKNAISDLNKAIKNDKKFIEAHLLLGECYLELKEPQMAKASFLQCLAINPDFFPPVYYSLAEIEFDADEYEEASKYLEKFLSYSKLRPGIVAKSEKMLQNARFAAQAVKNPVPFKPENIGLDFEHDQYWPTLSVDEQTLVFTGLIPKNPNNPAIFGNRQEDFFVSNFIDGSWTKPENLGPPLNTPDNEGAQTITADANKMYFTACNRPDGKGGCDIYYTEKRNGLWTRPRNLGEPINTSAKETQPSITADGRTLYFVSTRSGGKGGQDIWMSTLDNKGNWGKPVNVEEINTAGDESSPFIHLDGQTMYFASDGLPGMGQYDLFVTRKDSTGRWTTPQNLGYPINTKHSEEGMIVNARGNRAYYSSDRDGNVRNIFTFELYPEARPNPVSYMKGKIYDSRFYLPLKAHFELIDLSTAITVTEAYSDSLTGEFLVCIPSGKDYALNIKRKGYLFFSDNFTLNDGTYQEPYHKDIPLNRIRPGEKLILRNIFFDFASANLLDESKAELQQLVKFLRDNPEIKVSITGHTDNVGAQAYNLNLSQERARSVVNYITNEGILTNRVSYKGMGSSEPIADNNTEEGRAQNRRTELLIVE